jgi:hypothetical protein
MTMTRAARRPKVLTKELYRKDEDSILFVSQAVPGAAEIEDVVGETLMMKTTGEVLGTPVALNAADRAAEDRCVDAITSWAKRTGTALPRDLEVRRRLSDPQESCCGRHDRGSR